MYFDQGLMFFLGTWIGSNDLIMGSVCVTDIFLKQEHGKNEEKSEKA